MKHKIVIKIERELSSEELEHVKTLSENEVLELIEEQKKEIVSYFGSEDIKETDIKRLDIYLSN